MTQIRTRRDALLWQAVDRIFNGEDSHTVCADLQLDLIREHADRLLTRRDRLVTLLRETDPERIPKRAAA